MTMLSNPNRRRFLTALGTGVASLPLISFPAIANVGFAQRKNILVLIELSGGNDGLNTVVPIRDPAYRGLRPTIGIRPDEALGLDAETALHPSTKPLADLWQNGDLRIIEGVGYPDPNRSHFRSIEIWNAGLGAKSRVQDGWISSAFSQGRAPTSEVASGLSLGGGMGPLRGPGRFSAIRDEEGFLETIQNLPHASHPVRRSAGSPLEHVLATYDSAKITGTRISRRLEESASSQFEFPDSNLGEQLRTVSRLLEAGVDVPVFKVVQDGYDTHDNQPDAHAFLLGDLAEAIGAFSNAMKMVGLWQQVTVVTYSEFGRTARENASLGTDHGTAAPVFVAGGKVAGGIAGARVDLGKLVEDDLVHTTDYRDVYAAILRDLWSIEAPQFSTIQSSKITLF